MLPLLDEEWQPQTTLLSPFDNLSAATPARRRSAYPEHG